MSTAADLGTKRPEAVRLAITTWAVALAVELVHQITQITMSVLDPAELTAAARESAESAGTSVEGASDTLIELTVYGSIALMGLISLLVLVGLAVALRFYASRHRLADGSRRLLMVFSLYFGLRGLLVFAGGTISPGVPVWLMLLDGSLQLIVAVAAVLGLVFSGRKESVDYLASTAPTDADTPARK
ncbi:hypothetical protein [Corynebacterium doosanense]|uniref:Uncharacterized protein n=1 Tax=Corynebacterium doosanense CAU 212 = DSM 45436 TaxID=558173 RepID=A0A097IDN5_9CORY|nr:hypothetical protein [Corynebacterium doosanense]AIT60230.1 hypothetical protein CDOO_02395 [Corynebacterium doosanense CAU 212 = DSM 45436]